MLTRRAALAAAAVALGALAAGCGGSSQGATGRSVTPAEDDAPPATAAAPGVATAPAPGVATEPAPGVAKGALPSIVVNDVAAGTKVDLSTVPPADKPLLVWFWAPH